VRSTQSIPGIRSDYNVVESFGCPLPVVVNEALTFAGPGAGTVTAKVTQNGWAWVRSQRGEDLHLPLDSITLEKLLDEDDPLSVIMSD